MQWQPKKTSDKPKDPRRVAQSKTRGNFLGRKSAKMRERVEAENTQAQSGEGTWSRVEIAAAALVTVGYFAYSIYLANAPSDVRGGEKPNKIEKTFPLKVDFHQAIFCARNEFFFCLPCSQPELIKNLLNVNKRNSLRSKISA